MTTKNRTVFPQEAEGASKTQMVPSPSAEEQLKDKINALFEIYSLADQIKDAELFRKVARLIAESNKSMTYTCTISFTSPKPALKRKSAK